MSDSLRILWLKTGPLHPLDTGGKLRTYHLLRELKRRNEVTYYSLKESQMPLDSEVLRAAEEYSDHQRWFDWSEVSKESVGFYLDLMRNHFTSRRPYVIDKYRSKAMSEAIFQADQAGGFDVIVCDFLTPAVNLMPRQPHPTNTPTLLFQHNVEAQIWERMANTSGHWLKRRYLTGQWRRMQRFESVSCAAVTSVVGVSTVDCRRMREDYGLNNVLGSVPTGVDIDYFAQRESAPAGKELVFLGSMDWLPNIDAIEYFVEAIWSRVKQAHPDVTLSIVGRRPTAAVKALAARDEAISVTGTVPDVRPHCESAAAVIVPLRVGGGTRIKIYEAMSMGLPVVSTSIGAEGLDVTDGKNILIGDDPESFARAINGMLTDPARVAAIGTAAASHVRAHYSWSAVTTVFEEYCRAVAGRQVAEGVRMDSVRKIKG